METVDPRWLAGFGTALTGAHGVGAHGVGDRDSGISFGVLNTMQQVGGALGLALLSTVAVALTSDKVASLSSAAQAAGRRPGAGRGAPDADRQRGLHRGCHQAFLTGAEMIWLGTVIVLVFMNAKAEDLAIDETPEGVGV